MPLGTEARELTLHAENNEPLWNRRRPEFLKNSIRRKIKGTYDSGKAAKLWEYFADEAAASYTLEHRARGPHGRFGIFTKSDRREAAQHFRDQFEDEWKSGELKRDHPELFPKSAKKKVKKAKKKSSRKKATVKSSAAELRQCIRRDK